MDFVFNQGPLMHFITQITYPFCLQCLFPFFDRHHPCPGLKTPDTPGQGLRIRRGPAPIHLILYGLHHPAVELPTYRPLEGMLDGDHNTIPKLSVTSLTNTTALSHIYLTLARTSAPHSALIDILKRMQNHIQQYGDKLMCKLLTFHAVNREIDADIHDIFIKGFVSRIEVLVFEDFETFEVKC